MTGQKISNYMTDKSLKSLALSDHSSFLVQSFYPTFFCVRLIFLTSFIFLTDVGVAKWELAKQLCPNHWGRRLDLNFRPSSGVKSTFWQLWPKIWLKWIYWLFLFLVHLGLHFLNLFLSRLSNLIFSSSPLFYSVSSFTLLSSVCPDG